MISSKEKYLLPKVAELIATIAIAKNIGTSFFLFDSKERGQEEELLRDIIKFANSSYADTM